MLRSADRTKFRLGFGWPSLRSFYLVLSHTLSSDRANASFPPPRLPFPPPRLPFPRPRLPFPRPLLDTYHHTFFEMLGNSAAIPTPSAVIPTLPAVHADLTVDSDPPGATITLDGDMAVKAPHTFKGVKVGGHRLTATLEGYYPQSGNSNSMARCLRRSF